MNIITSNGYRPKTACLLSQIFDSARCVSAEDCTISDIFNGQFQFITFESYTGTKIKVIPKGCYHDEYAYIF